jgi:hypothetical protein
MGVCLCMPLGFVTIPQGKVTVAGIHTGHGLEGTTFPNTMKGRRTAWAPTPTKWRRVLGGGSQHRHTETQHNWPACLPQAHTDMGH